MNSLLSKRRTQKIGKGSFVTARRILPSSSDAQKRVSLAGRVVKRLVGRFDLHDGIRIKKMIKEYTQKLNLAKVPTIRTDVRLVPTKKAGKLKLLMIQDFVPQENILSNRLKKCSSQEAVYWFIKTKEMIENLNDYNRTHHTRLGLDALSKNIGIVEGNLVLIDLYPAYVRGEQKIEVEDIAKRKRGFFRAIKRNIFPKGVEEKATKTLIKKMELDLLLRDALFDFESKRPELIDKFVEAL